MKSVRLLVFGVPLAFGAILVLVISNIFYYEGRRENILSLIESKYLEVLLPLAPKKEPIHPALLIISAKDTDGNVFHKSNYNDVRDLSLNAYKNVINITYERHRPEVIFVNPLSYAHSKRDLLEFLRFFIQHPASQRLMFTLPRQTLTQLPLDVKSHLNVLQSIDCVYDINSYCTVEPGSIERLWIPKVLQQTLWNSPPHFHISTNLPHIHPNILLKLRKEIESVSFSQAISQYQFSEPKKVIFIGNSMEQIERYSQNKNVTMKTMYASRGFAQNNLAHSGVAFHEFWALIADIMMSHKTIAIAPRLTTGFIGTIWVLSLIALFINQSFSLSMPLFGLLLLIITAINYVGVQYVGFYLPIAEIAFVNFASIVIIGASYFSYITYKRLVQKDLDAHIAQMSLSRSNFIALISHNLVTPLARLITTLEAMIRRTESINRGFIQSILFQTYQLLIGLKSVLLLISLQQGKDFNEDCSLEDFIQHQLKNELDLLSKRFQIDIEWKLEPELNPQIKVSSKVILLLILCYIYALNAKDFKLVLKSFSPPGEPTRLHLSSTVYAKYQDNTFSDFLTSILRKLVKMSSNHTQITLDSDLIFDFKFGGFQNELRNL